MNKYIYIFIFIIFMLVGCNSENKSVKSEESEGIVDAVVKNMPVYNDIYSIYIEDSYYNLSLYEPREKCYLGAYILSDKVVNFNIGEFEARTGKKHSNYVYHMKLGEPFPLKWVLECYSLMKTPYIIMEASDSYNPFKYELLEETAESFGEFYIPMFIEFYPNPQNNNYDKEEYKLFFKKAYDTFKQKASNAAFVWSVDVNGVYDSNFYYPGNESTDWVGINIYKTFDENGEMINIDKNIDYFYYLYQKDKPIMISQLAISHFSSKGHKYFNDKAAEEIENLYLKTLNNYPRIKSINYMDINNMEFSPKNSVNDNFSITDDEKILNAYKNSISNDKFISELSIIDSGEKNKELFKSPFEAYNVENQIYISKNTIIYDLNYKDISNLDENIESIIIENEYYYNLNQLSNKLKFKVDLNKKEKKAILKFF